MHTLLISCHSYLDRSSPHMKKFQQYTTSSLHVFLSWVRETCGKRIENDNYPLCPCKQLFSSTITPVPSRLDKPIIHWRVPAGIYTSEVNRGKEDNPVSENRDQCTGLIHPFSAFPNEPRTLLTRFNLQSSSLLFKEIRTGLEAFPRQLEDAPGLPFTSSHETPLKPPSLLLAKGSLIDRVLNV